MDLDKLRAAADIDALIKMLEHANPDVRAQRDTIGWVAPFEAVTVRLHTELCRQRDALIEAAGGSDAA